MRRYFLFLVLVITLAGVCTPKPSLARYASIVVNETTGKVMYSRNADQKLFPASLTKVMTLYLVFEQLEAGTLTMTTRMKVSRVAASRSPSKLYLPVGSSITVRDAILTLITKSANDVATVVAEHISGTEREFGKRMTRKAKALGMVNTTFRNASGLPHYKQQSTARDMARLAIAIRKDFPQYFNLFKTRTYTWQGKKFRNHNKLLTNFNGTDGIKTGYIRASGFNLIATVERGGIRLVGVVFGAKTSKSRNAHMQNLLTKQFERASITPVIHQAKAPPQQVEAPPRRPARPASNPPILPTPRPNIIADLPELADPTPTPTPTVSSWEVQIGHFQHRAHAHNAARDARVAADSILGIRPARLNPVDFGAAQFWQVRFDDLKIEEAQEICSKLYQQGMACIVIPDLTV